MTNGTASGRRRLRAWVSGCLAIFVLMTFISRDAAAQGPGAVEIGGLVDAYYLYDNNKPAGDVPYRNWDTKHNKFAFAMAEAWFNKAPTTDSRAGFNIKLNFGPATSIVHASEPGTTEIFKNIQQGYVSYLAPWGKGLQFDFGKFVTQHGAEVIETKDNWNYSHSLLFAWAIPYYHMGLRASYPFNDKFTLAGAIVNGWNNVVENNDRKTYGVQAVVKPVSQVSIVQNYMGGPEQPNDNEDWRHLSDTTLTVTATPELSFIGNYDYGKDTVAGQDVHWQGVAGYAKYQVNKWVAVIPRAEWFDDPQGFTTGTAQTLKEGTVTVELKGADNFLWRIEYRGDFSDKAVFKKDTGQMKKNQHTIAFGLLYSFSTKP